jgi:dUTP pyrophosphatase
MVKLSKKLSQKMSSTLKQIKEYTVEDQKKSDVEIFDHVGLDLKRLERLSNETTDSLVTPIDIKFINKSDLPDPVHQHVEDSGFDLRADIKEDVSLKPLERKLIPTGLFFEIHDEYELQVRPRSGLAIKHGITVLNTPGTVDSNYRGEVKVILVNLSNEKYTIKRGDRIAQGVVAYVLKSKWSKLKKVINLSPSTRGEGGFGSTGK